MLLESNEQYLRHGIQVEVSAEAKEYLLDKGFDSRFGARPLRQRLLKDLDAPLADLLSSGGVPSGSKVLWSIPG
jgi:ATP-dependent Clp protease ATP-binding subunit ClpA